MPSKKKPEPKRKPRPKKTLKAPPVVYEKPKRQPPPKPQGRPKKLNLKLRDVLDDTVIRLICRQVGRGAFLTTAAASVGVRNETVHMWLRRGALALKKKDDSKEEAIYKQFTLAYRRATARYELQNLDKINSSPDWKSAQWLLSKKNKDWRDDPKEKIHTLRGDPKKPITTENRSVEVKLIDVKKLPLAIAEKLLEAIESQDQEKVDQIIESSAKS